MGADALRLWAASSDYTRDVTIGQPVLISVNQALHKYRVTFKWMLGIFSLPSCPPPFPSFNNLTPDSYHFHELTDRLAMHRLVQVSAEVHNYFGKYEFFKGVNTINKYISNDLSAFYFETLKDRIYTGDKTDCETLQHVLGLIFYELLQMLAPICPLLVEEVWDHVPESLRESTTHPARALWSPLCARMESESRSLERMSEVVNSLGGAIKVAQERLRAEKKIGSSLESEVTVYLSEASARALRSEFLACMHSSTHESQDIQTQFAGLFVVSEFNVRVLQAPSTVTHGVVFKVEDPETMKQGWRWWEEEVVASGDDNLGKARVVVHPPSKEKCPRCWRFLRNEAEEICRRCDDVIKQESEVVAV
jgi:isoleucyl-tRNA synthetase